MFLEKEELKSSIYEYQLEQITESDDTIIDMGIATAIEEVRSYLTPNFKSKFKDGRLLYDTDAIFAAEGTDRNPLILSMTKTCAVYHIIQLCNADVIYEQAKERYDRAIKYLDKLKTGEVTLSMLPQLDPNEAGNVANQQPFIGDSRPKFNFE